MERVRLLELSAEQVGTLLELSPRRVRQLYCGYLKAYGQGAQGSWTPGHSGGARKRELPAKVEAEWKRWLSGRPSYSYSFVASETDRLFDFHVDRATVRRWALARQLDPHKPKDRSPACVRRWQCLRVGELWQLDVSSHAWFGEECPKAALFDIIDDCSRLIPCARLYPRECHLAYLDFLPRAFEAYGMPLEIYVDHHSFFFSQVPDSATYLSECLRFYGMHFRYAPTAQAKGKVERLHGFWQNRLPAYFAAHPASNTEQANPHIDALRLHHNSKEIHREIGMTPQAAWTEARRQGRLVLRPKPACPWWRYVWSVRSRVRVDLDGTVPAGTHRVRINRPVFSVVTRCEHPDGSFTFLAQPPGSGGRPVVLLRLESAGSTWNV